MRGPAKRPTSAQSARAGAVRRWIVPAVGLLTFGALLLPFALGSGASGNGAGQSPAVARSPQGPAAIALASIPEPSAVATTAVAATAVAASLSRGVAPGNVQAPSQSATQAPAVAASRRPQVVAPKVVAPDGKRHMVDIGGGRRLAIWCVGSGSPTVILEHGLGYNIDSDSWPTVQNGVGRFTRVCRYDRAFTGFSDDAKVGRSMPDLAADLHALLRAAGLTGPYVLVGHSFGGLSVRYYALRYPTDVAGMVLVDGSAPYAIESLSLGSERLNHARVMAQLKGLKRMGSIPLVVVTRGIGAGIRWKAAQADMVKLSTRGRQVVATTSDHWIQLRQPALVVRQVQTVVNTIRRHG